jgi:voltage-gated potassium channel
VKRRAILVGVERKFETPMLLLSFVWLFVLITEVVYGMLPALLWIGTIIWVMFGLFFLLKLATVPNRTIFLRKNWLFLSAILLPVLRYFPFLQKYTAARVLTATFGLQVVWVFASANIGMRSLRKKMGRRGVGYALTFTLIVIAAGAAGMLSFEQGGPDPEGIHSYPKALWWTAMQMTNIGSGYRPVSVGGEVLSLGISVYAAGMFGYLTALLATVFIGRDAEDPKSKIAGESSILQLRTEVGCLRESIEEVLRRLPVEGSPEIRPSPGTDPSEVQSG